MRRGELESRILILVTLALVAFGLVMVYSATSAAAAVGGGNPNYYLERQGIYGALGIVLMILAQRWDYRRLARSRRCSSSCSLVLLVAVLVIGPPINGARRWISFGPAVFQPSELAKLALAIWAAAYLSRRTAPRTLEAAVAPARRADGVFALLLVARARPRHDDRARADARRHAGRRRDAGARARRGARDRVGCRLRGHLDRAVQPRALLRLPASVARRAGHRLPDRPGEDRHGLGPFLRRRARAGGRRRSSTCPRRTPT